MNKEDKIPLLKENTHDDDCDSYSISNSNSSSTESIIDIESDNLSNLDNNWINCYSRYYGKTEKMKDSNDKWKYRTKFPSGKVIDEKYIIINNKEYFMKEIWENNGKITLELLNINNNLLVITYETYERKTDYINSLSTLGENIYNFKQKEQELSPENKFLEGVIINNISTIDKFIKNIESFNENLIKFKEEQDNRDLNTLLKLYKYLTVMQNFLDSSKSNSGIFKKILNTRTNLTVGALQIYIGLTGKNLQRVISNYPIDGKEHTGQDYVDAIFLNWQNYLMVLIDTALATFLTSSASSWSRDVIFNKQTKATTFKINRLNLDEFEKFKDIFEALLYEENHQELMKHFSKIIGINDLIKKFNEIENSENSIEFNYHQDFKKEVENVKKIISLNNNETEIKELVSQANKDIKKFTKSQLKPVKLTQNWGCNLLVNSTLETLTWATSHVILTGSAENMSKESFNLQDWITKDIFSIGAFSANLSRYFVMRPINNIFKSGLERLGIPTNLCPDKFSKWLDKQSRSKKLLMAIPLFLTITFIVNAVKSEAALTTEHGLNKATELFYEKFFRLTTLGFSVGVTMIDMIAFAISDFYKDVFKKKEADLFEDNFKKLEINGKLPTFDEAFENQQQETININFSSEPSTSGLTLRF